MPVSTHFADRLVEGIKSKGTPIAIGLDPVYSRLPEAIRENKDLNDELDTESAIDAIFEFSTRILRAVAPHVAAVKLNIASNDRSGLWHIRAKELASGRVAEAYVRVK